MKKTFIKFGARFENSRGKLNWGYKTRQFFYGTLFPREKAHYLWRAFFNPTERIEILGKQHKDLVYDSDPFHIFKRYYGASFVSVKAGQEIEV